MIYNKEFQELIEPGDLMVSDNNKNTIFTFEKFTECLNFYRNDWPEECSICHGKIKVKESIHSKCMRANPIENPGYILKYTIKKTKIDFGIEEKDWFI